MTGREKNGMATLIRELKKGIKDEVDDSKRSVNASSESDEKSRDGEEDRTTYRFHFCSDVPALCPHTHSIRYHQHSMNHREQFSLSVMSETVFNFRTLCCPLGIPSAKSGEFEQHDSLRLKQPSVYS